MLTGSAIRNLEIGTRHRPKRDLGIPLDPGCVGAICKAADAEHVEATTDGPPHVVRHEEADRILAATRLA